MTRTRVLGATFIALLLSMPAGSVLAQTPEPVERTQEMEQRAADLTTLFPAELAGVSLVDDLTVQVGRELLAELDPSDSDDAEQIADIHEIMEAAGATIDDAVIAFTFVELAEGEGGFVAAYQILGSDAQQTLPLWVAALEEDVAEPRVEQRQIADRDVTVVLSDESPDAAPFVLLASDDVTWLLSVPERFMEEAVDSFPDP